MNIQPRFLILAVIVIALTINHIDVHKQRPEQSPTYETKTDNFEIIGLSSLPQGTYTLVQVRPVRYIEPNKTVGQYAYEVENREHKTLRVIVFRPRTDVEKPKSIIEVDHLGRLKITPPR